MKAVVREKRKMEGVRLGMFLIAILIQTTKKKKKKKRENLESKLSMLNIGLPHLEVML